jgi:hypothetical protein
MQKTDRYLRAIGVAILVILTLPSGAATKSDGVKSSITTVDDLLVQENNKLLEKERLATQLTNKARPQPIKTTVPLEVRVEAIFGTDKSLHADLVVNGMTYNSVGVGATLGGCVIKTIANQCVTFAPKDVKTTAAYCKAACWTGYSAAPVMMINGGAGGGAPLPPGMLGAPSPFPATAAAAARVAPSKIPTPVVKP